MLVFEYIPGSRFAYEKFGFRVSCPKTFYDFFRVARVFPNNFENDSTPWYTQRVLVDMSVVHYSKLRVHEFHILTINAYVVCVVHILYFNL